MRTKVVLCRWLTAHPSRSLYNKSVFHVCGRTSQRHTWRRWLRVPAVHCWGFPKPAAPLRGPAGNTTWKPGHCKMEATAPPAAEKARAFLLRDWDCKVLTLLYHQQLVVSYKQFSFYQQRSQTTALSTRLWITPPPGLLSHFPKHSIFLNG